MKYCEDSTVEKLERKARACATRRAGAGCEAQGHAAGHAGAVAKLENTPMSDNLLKKRIHHAKNLNTMQIIRLRCVFCLAFSRLSDIGV